MNFKISDLSKVFKSRDKQKTSLQESFSEIYSKNSFNGAESRSGPGSEAMQTSRLQSELPAILKHLSVETFCDVPCGDFNWMRNVELGKTEYFGFDIVEDLVESLQINFESEKRHFAQLNLVENSPGSFDLILCRDLLVHLNFEDALRAISNIRGSGSKYLLTTTFPSRRVNQNISYDTRNVGWYPINLELPPFNFGPPLRLVNEDCTEGNGAFKDKSLALYEIESI